MGRNWKELTVWKESHDMVIELYKLLGKFPKEETYNLVSQIKRAAVSVPTNIVEGHSKGSKKEFLRFLYISRGSLEELKYLLFLSFELGYIDKENFDKFNQKLSRLGYMLNRLIKSLTPTNPN